MRAGSSDRGDGAPLPDPRIVRDRFEKLVEHWDEMYERRDVVAAARQERERQALAWVDALALPAGTRALELGCGAGRVTAALAQRGFLVSAVDVADGMLECTRRRAADHGVAARVQLARTRAETLPFCSGSFAVVVALGVLPWMPSPGDAIREVVRVLEPGGAFITSMGNSRNIAIWLDPRRSPLSAPLRAGGRRLLRAVGRPWRSPVEDLSLTFPRSAFRQMLEHEGLRTEAMVALGFGPFTFFDHPVLPESVALRANAVLQRLASRGAPLVRSAGEQFLALAVREPAVADAPRESGARPDSHR